MREWSAGSKFKITAKILRTPGLAARIEGMATFLSDLRYALRTLGRSPGYAAIVILILAAGIGANTAMFSIVDGVLLRALPFHEPEQLYAVQESVPKFASLAPDFPVNAMHAFEWRKHWTAAEQVALIDSQTFNLTSGGEPEKVNAERVTGNLFPMLGVQPQLGRGFLPEEDQEGRDQVILLSDSLWRRRFHADPAVLRQKLLLNGKPYEVIGVMPAGLKLPRVSQLQSMHLNDADPDIWKPFAATKDDIGDVMGDFNFGCIVRMKKGVSASQALEELNAIQADIIRGFPEKIELRGKLSPLQQQLTGRSRKGLLLLLAAVGAVLLIVCVNIANLMLARATGRRREFAIRAAVGASTRRLLRQMLTESLVVAVLGGALGIAFAYAVLDVILTNAPLDVARLNEVHIDGRVLAVACGLSFLSAVLFGLLPAWRSSRIDPQEGLRSGGRSATEARHSGRVRTVLVALEVGLSTVCLAAAGLLLNSFVRLTHVDKGFDTEHVMSVELYLPPTRYSGDEKRSEFLRKVLEAVRPLPGITALGVVNQLPLTGEGNNNLLFVEGVNVPIMERPLVDTRSVNGDYFHAMGIPLEAGRVFEESDRKLGVVIMGESTARKVWPGENPIGKKVHFGEKGPLLEVIGIAGDVRANGLQKDVEQVVYMPYWHRGRAATPLVIRTVMPPTAIAGGVRAVLHQLDPELPVPQFKTMQDIVSASVAERKFQLTLVLAFAGIALVLACLGIFGVVSYTVAQRRGEMGIRLALGATAGDLRTMVVRQGLAPVLIGLGFGIAGALAMGRVLQGLLFGVKATDPWTLAGVSAILIAVAAAACYIPAMRVSRADPLTALRYE
jgi:predicted permease